MSEYPWCETNITGTWLSSLYNSFNIRSEIWRRSLRFLKLLSKVWFSESRSWCLFIKLVSFANDSLFKFFSMFAVVLTEKFIIACEVMRSRIFLYGFIWFIWYQLDPGMAGPMNACLSLRHHIRLSGRL